MKVFSYKNHIQYSESLLSLDTISGLDKIKSVLFSKVVLCSIKQPELFMLEAYKYVNPHQYK